MTFRLRLHYHKTMSIDLQELAQAIRAMKYRTPLYRVLKAELGRLGNWRNKPRGDPAKGYRMKGSKGG